MAPELPFVDVTTLSARLAPQVRPWRLGATMFGVFGGGRTTRLAHSPAELERFLQPLVDAGVDMFHCSTRRFWEPEFPEENSDMNLAGWTKKLSGKPIDDTFRPRAKSSNPARSASLASL